MWLMKSMININNTHVWHARAGCTWHYTFLCMCSVGSCITWAWLSFNYKILVLWGTPMMCIVNFSTSRCKLQEFLITTYFFGKRTSCSCLVMLGVFEPDIMIIVRWSTGQNDLLEGSWVYLGRVTFDTCN